MRNRHKVFVSYHHALDESYKNIPDNSCDPFGRNRTGNEWTD